MMRIWTDLKSFVALSPKGTFIFREGRLNKSWPALSGDVDAADDEAFSVTPSGNRCWTSKAERMDLQDGTITKPKRAIEAIDLVALDEEQLAIVAGKKGSKSDPELLVGDPIAARWQAHVALVGKAAIKAQAPKAVWEKGTEPPWSRSPGFGPSGNRIPRHTRLDVSPQGLAVAGKVSGLVGVLRPGATELDFVLRLPVAKKSDLHAMATAQGVLVTLIFEDRAGALLHFDREGRCLGSAKISQGIFRSLLVDEVQVVASGESSAEAKLRFFKLPGLSEIKVDEPVSLPSRPVDGYAGHKGKGAAFVDSDGNITALTGIPGEVDLDLAGSISIAIRDEAASKARAERVRETMRFREADGPPALTFSAMKTESRPWQGQKGDALAFPLLFRSCGKKGHGIRVEVSGPAIEKKIVVPKTVGLRKHQASFAPTGTPILKYVAELPQAEFPQGLAYPLDPKPQGPEASAWAQEVLAKTHIELSLHLTARTEGSELLSISASALQGCSSPIKWTRPVTVRD